MKSKNIHILPTDKPSRLIKSQDNDFIFLNTDAPNWFEINFKTTKQNIYITSDEEIKEGYFLDLTHNIVMKAVFYPSSDKNCKKIILTTDQDLIKDGVQEIPDEFLEWFVKNPSCEWVELKNGVKRLNLDGEEVGFPDMSLYKIIIPTEEPKQETLEEVAKKYAELSYYGDEVDAFVRGAKWQSERMYSEEEVVELNLRYLQELGKQQSENGHWINFKEWFEQFKKK